jgi:hypothetical protein
MEMSAIVNPVIAGVCKNCGESTRGYYVALKNGKYSHIFNCKREGESNGL